MRMMENSVQRRLLAEAGFSQALLIFDRGGCLVSCCRRAAALLALPPGLAAPGTAYAALAPWLGEAAGAPPPAIADDEDDKSAAAAVAGGDGNGLPGSAWTAFRGPDGQALIKALVPLTGLGFAIAIWAARDATMSIDRRLADLFETLGEAIISIDANHIITDFNREAARLCGYQADEVIGRPLDILLPSDSATRHRALVQVFADGAEVRRFMGGRPTIRGRRKDGSEFIAEASISKSEINGEIMFTAVLRDVTELRRAEAALRDSEQRFRDIAEIASDLIWELDSELRFTSMAGGKRYGDRDAQRNVIGKTPWDATGADPTKHELWARCRADLEAHRPFRNFAYSVAPREGRLQHYRVSGTPIFDDNGVFAGYRGITTDETETMSALVRARDAEDLLRSAVDSISEGFVIFDKDDRLAMCNQAYRALFQESEGQTPPHASFESITRNALAKGLYANVAGRQKSWIQERVRSHREATGSIEQWRTDGRVYLVTDRRMPDGGTAGLRMDVTRLKQAEAALRESQSLLHTTFETISEGVVVIDETLHIAALNSRLLRLLGIRPDTLKIGDPAETLVRACHFDSSKDEDELEQNIQRELAKIRTFQPAVAERSFRNGSVLEIHDDTLPGGGLVRTYRDITMHKRAENELRSAAFHAQKASEAKSEFMTTMSHELRTPLNAIIGFSEVMRDGLFGPLSCPRYQEYAHHIHKSGSHLLAIINNILEFAKAESGSESLNETEVDIAAVIHASVDALRLQAEQDQIALAVEVPSSPPRVVADEIKLKQIVMNLMSNAVKFTPSGGSVTLRCVADATSGVTLQIIDTGIGMAAEEIPIALEPFRQLDGRLNRKYPGTGLGLPLTRRLVELHGGSFAIDSQPGRGTVVTATFPAQRVLPNDPSSSRSDAR